MPAYLRRVRYEFYADGEKLYDPFIYRTRIGASEQGERPKFIPSGKPETWVHVNRAGVVTLGMPVVLLRFNVGHLTVVLPQNLENSRS